MIRSAINQTRVQPHKCIILFNFVICFTMEVRLDFYSLTNLLSRGSAFGIATGYGLDDRGVEVRVQEGARIFTSACRPEWL
jgi:hypothetical protein